MRCSLGRLRATAASSLPAADAVTAAAPVISLREATRRAKDMGHFDATRAAASPVLRRCTDPVSASASPRSGAAPKSAAAAAASGVGGHDAGSRSDRADTWNYICEQQHRMFSERHTTTVGSIGVVPSCVNVAHLSVTVSAVHCGYRASHAGGPTGQGLPGRRTLTPSTRPPNSYAELLLWTWMSQTEPLAVRCHLSHGALCTCWRVSKAPFSVRGVPEGELLQRTREWAEELVLGRQVIVSGQLRMEEVYDGDLQRAVTVPALELPMDSFKSSVTLLPRRMLAGAPESA